MKCLTFRTGVVMILLALGQVSYAATFTEAGLILTSYAWQRGVHRIVMEQPEPYSQIEGIRKLREFSTEKVRLRTVKNNQLGIDVDDRAFTNFLNGSACYTYSSNTTAYYRHTGLPTLIRTCPWATGRSPGVAPQSPGVPATEECP